MEDPLDEIHFDDVLRHGDPTTWKFLGPKKGSPARVHSLDAQEGAMKHYDLYRDEFGDLIEVHYFRNPDGSVSVVSIKD